ARSSRSSGSITVTLRSGFIRQEYWYQYRMSSGRATRAACGRCRESPRVGAEHGSNGFERATFALARFDSIPDTADDPGLLRALDADKLVSRFLTSPRTAATA